MIRMRSSGQPSSRARSRQPILAFARFAVLQDLVLRRLAYVDGGQALKVTVRDPRRRAHRTSLAGPLGGPSVPQAPSQASPGPGAESGATPPRVPPTPEAPAAIVPVPCPPDASRRRFRSSSRLRNLMKSDNSPSSFGASGSRASRLVQVAGIHMRAPSGISDVQVQPVMAATAAAPSDDLDFPTVERMPETAQKDRSGRPETFKWCSGKACSQCPNALGPR